MSIANRILAGTLLVVACFSSVKTMNAQESASVTSTFMHNKYMLERLGSSDQLMVGTVQELPPSPPTVIGDDCMNPHFQVASFVLNDGSTLENLQVRYFITRNEFDVKTKKGLRALKGDRVKSFMWLDSASRRPQLFINARQLRKPDGTPGLGFLQLITEGGKISLVKQTVAIFKEANYHVALNVGSQDHQFIKKDIIYYVTGNKLLPIPARKKIPSIFPDHKEEIERFIRTNSLDFAKLHHLIALVNYYNSLEKL